MATFIRDVLASNTAILERYRKHHTDTFLDKMLAVTDGIISELDDQFDILEGNAGDEDEDDEAAPAEHASVVQEPCMIERWPLSEYRQTINTAVDCISLQPRLLRSAMSSLPVRHRCALSSCIRGPLIQRQSEMTLFILAAF